MQARPGRSRSIRLARPTLGVVFLLVGALVIAWGVFIAAGDPYDIGRAGLVIFGGAFALTGLVVVSLAVLFLLRRPLVRVHAIVALGLALVGLVALFSTGWLVTAFAFAAALLVVAHGFATHART